jgi:hypothetical protein
MMGAGMVGRDGLRRDCPAVFLTGCEGGASYGSGQDSNSSKHFEFGHIVSSELL